MAELDNVVGEGTQQAVQGGKGTRSNEKARDGNGHEVGEGNMFSLRTSCFGIPRGPSDGYENQAVRSRVQNVGEVGAAATGGVF